jgi:hypothetical protein
MSGKAAMKTAGSNLAETLRRLPLFVATAGN